MYLFQNILPRWLFYLRDYFFPFGCAVCGAGLAGMEEAWYGLCGPCRRKIEANLSVFRAGGYCDRCGRPLVSEQGRCLPCRNGEDMAFNRLIVLFPYSGAYRRLLGAYKFGKNLALGNFFAERIRTVLKDFGKDLFPEEAVIVPVPPRPGKIKASGWDQIEYLARLLARGQSGGRRVLRCLKRLPSKTQKKLDRVSRRTNLQGRIRLQKKAPDSAILIDDVTTTGSTMDACAAVLKAGGTKSVYGICLFYD
jgi:ComF family protein